MRINSRTRWMGRVALVVALALVPLGASAQQPVDSDGDGFDDASEGAGLALATGLTMLDGSGTRVSSIPNCAASGAERQFCVDPGSPDLFAILVPASTSGLPLDPFASTSADAAAGGLGVSVHVLSAADPTGSRLVSPGVSGQNAVRITESLDAPGDKIGLANYGSPNDLDGSTIWTARIGDFVSSACTSDALCRTSEGASGIPAVTEALTRWVLNHEVGHLFALTASYNKRFGGYHLKAGEDAMLTQFVDYDTARKTGVTTFYIPETFSDQSRADKLLQ